MGNKYQPEKNINSVSKPKDLKRKYRETNGGNGHNSKYHRDQPIAEFRKSLPIYSARDKIVSEIKSNPAVIVVGETGSGKTTQIPQFLYESGFSDLKGQIAVTQPRRVAAISLATRVSEEQGTVLGETVGYSVRFDDKSSANTKIKYMTDGMLLREVLSDRNLSRYSVIILDEAHERTLRTDVLFGIVKELLNSRNDLKVVVMSATLDAEKFSAYFNGAKILYIEGRMYPVRVMATIEPQPDYLDSTLVTIFQIHSQYSQGDILAFLTGQEDIESLEKLIKEFEHQCPKNLPKLIVCPLFANLPTSQQSMVFKKTPLNHRKVVLATNIAETSITISGIKYVVDCGLQKVRGFDSKVGMETLSIKPISKASARQRMGRAGRESAGICFRLYDEKSFEELKENEVPEIRRCRLSNVALMMKASGIKDILKFDFMDRPSKESLIDALEELYVLDALDSNQKLTSIGYKMAEFPVEPALSKVLLKSQEFGCVAEILDIISLLSVENIFFSPNDKRELAAEAKKKFISVDGDHLTLFNVLQAYLQSGKDKKWCHQNFIHSRSMHQVIETRKQLRRFCNRLNIKFNDVDDAELRISNTSVTDKILQALLTGFFTKIAALQPDGKTYKSLFNGQIVSIHPSSVLFGKKEPYVMYHDLIWTSKRYMRIASVVQKKWIASYVS